MEVGAKGKAVRTLWGRWDSLLVLVGWELFVSTYQFSEVGGVIAPWVFVHLGVWFVGVRGFQENWGLDRDFELPPLFEILLTHISSRYGVPGSSLFQILLTHISSRYGAPGFISVPDTANPHLFEMWLSRIRGWGVGRDRWCGGRGFCSRTVVGRGLGRGR
jgi:hypothetical protein